MSARMASGASRGPAAFGDDFRRFANLTLTLALTDFKLRFFGSVLGYLWTLMRPLMLFGVIYIVFTEVVKFGADVKYYGVYLLTSIVLFTFFSESTSNGVRALVDRENLLRKIRFPRLVIPLSVALAALFNLLANMVVVFAFVFASGITPRPDWVQLPLLIGVLVVLATGVTMLTSALFVRYRDVEPIWEVALQILFYASPVLYVVTLLPDKWESEVTALNPIATVLTQTRHALIDADAPTAVDVLGGWPRLAIPLAIVAAIFALGLWVFTRETPRIAENL
ncbi:MAG TPA: ABC transporter permease [Thermoleophilaceae bacterium]|nr:ABC transporter permease [Thermoleophilaceae bacterium]